MEAMIVSYSGGGSGWIDKMGKQERERSFGSAV